MARLIDADVMLEELKDMEVVIAQQNIADWIDEQPTVDAVEVVRCKDCVCSRELDGIEKLIYTEKTLMCGLFDSAVAEDGFCSEGERRGD